MDEHTDTREQAQPRGALGWDPHWPRLCHADVIRSAWCWMRADGRLS